MRSANSATPRAAGPLMLALKDPDKYVRYGAALALEKLGKAPGTIKERAFYLAARQDWTALAALGEDAVPGACGRACRPRPGSPAESGKRLREYPERKGRTGAHAGALRSKQRACGGPQSLQRQRAGSTRCTSPGGSPAGPGPQKTPLVAGFLNFLLPRPRVRLPREMVGDHDLPDRYHPQPSGSLSTAARTGPMACSSRCTLSLQPMHGTLPGRCRILPDPRFFAGFFSFLPFLTF